LNAFYSTLSFVRTNRHLINKNTQRVDKEKQNQQHNVIKLMLAPKITQSRLCLTLRCKILKKKNLANIGNISWNVLNEIIFRLTIKLTVLKFIMEICFGVDDFASEKNTSRRNHFIN